MTSGDQGGHRSGQSVFGVRQLFSRQKGGGIPSYRPWKYPAALLFIQPRVADEISSRSLALKFKV